LNLNKNEPYAIRDEAIGSRLIALRDLNGEFHPRAYLRDVLQSIDRSIYRVVLIRERDRNDPASLPVCTILSSADIAAHKKRQKLQEKERAKKKRLLEPKHIEINWGSDKNDLETKMKRMCDFLRQGRRVEVLLAPKKRKQRNWTHEEASSIVSSIRQRTNEVDGTKEYKKPEGKVGEFLTLFFEGRELPKVEQEEAEAEAEA
jgi:translation initiation factor IF-3